MGLEEQYHEFETGHENATVWPYMAPANEKEHIQIAKAQAERFSLELRDVIGCYTHTSLGLMEQNGAIIDGPLKHLTKALNSLELLSQSLINQ